MRGNFGNAAAAAGALFSLHSPSSARFLQKTTNVVFSLRCPSLFWYVHIINSFAAYLFSASEFHVLTPPCNRPSPLPPCRKSGRQVLFALQQMRCRPYTPRLRRPGRLTVPAPFRKRAESGVFAAQSRFTLLPNSRFIEKTAAELQSPRSRLVFVF